MKRLEGIIKINNFNELLKPRSMVTNLLDRLSDTYLIIFGLRALISLVLQCTYVQMQRSQSSYQSINQIRNIMLQFGQPFRECNTSGVFYYSVHLYSWIVYYFLRRIPSGDWSKYLSNGGLLSYLENPAREEKIILGRINELIRNLIESNINFTRIILDPQKFDQKTIILDDRKTFKKVQPTSVRCKEISASNKLAREIAVYSLTSQLNYLNELKLNTTKVWPPNRVSEWAVKIRGYWFKIYATSYANIWFVCTACAVVSVNLTHKNLIESNLSDKNYAKFTLFDRFWIFNILLYCAVAVGWYVTSLTVALISICDQLRFVNSFKPKLCHLGSRMNKLDDIRKKFLSLSGDRSFKNISNFNSDKVIQNIKIECDNIVVEFYITFRLFRDGLKDTLELTQEIVGHCVSFITATLLTTLIFYDRVPTDHLTILVAASIAGLISTNCVFVLCAALHASSCRITNLIWPLITLAENCNLNYHNCPFESKSNFGFSDDNFDFEYHSNSLISPHTVFLLRKIAANDVFLAKSCVCRLYGTIPLDYEGVMRINFWLISSILLALTYHN